MATEHTNINPLTGEMTDRLKRLENHVDDIRDRQANYEDALRELAQNMNKIAIQLAEREADREKLRQVAEDMRTFKEDFAAYREKQLEEKVKDSRVWIRDTLQWVAGIVGALIIFHFTGNLLK